MSSDEGEAAAQDYFLWDQSGLERTAEYNITGSFPTTSMRMLHHGASLPLNPSYYQPLLLLARPLSVFYHRIQTSIPSFYLCM